MNSIQVKINNHLVMLCQPVETKVVSVQVVNFGLQVPVHKADGERVAKWLYELTQRASGIITYNGIIIAKEDVQELGAA